MPNLSVLEHLALFTAVAFACSFLVLYLRESQKRQRLLSVTPGEVIQETQTKSRQIILKALKKAQEILGQAEKESTETVNIGKSQTKELTDNYMHQMTELLQKMEQGFSQQIGLAESAYVKYLGSLESKSEESERANQEFIRQRSEAVIKSFEDSSTSFLRQMGEQSTAAIDQEIKAARASIDSYKQQQLTLIDENVIAILERTLSLVMAKKLTLKDQMEIVYEALEKAKVEKFIV